MPENTQQNEPQSDNLSIPYGGDTSEQSARPTIKEELDAIHNKKRHALRFGSVIARSTLGKLAQSALVTPIFYKAVINPSGTILEPPSYSADVQASSVANGDVRGQVKLPPNLFTNRTGNLTDVTGDITDGVQSTIPEDLLTDPNNPDTTLPPSEGGDNPSSLSNGFLGSVVIFYFIHWIAAAKCRNDSNRCLSFSNLENNLL